MQDILTFLNKHIALTSAAIILIAALAIIEWLRARRATYLISPFQATQLINHDNATVIDLRSNELFQLGHIIDAKSMPLASFDNEQKKLDKLKTKALIFVCQNGSDASRIAANFKKQGFNAYAIAGGMRSWLDAQMPTVKGK